MAIDVDFSSLKSEDLVRMIINSRVEDFDVRNNDSEFAFIRFTNFCSNACFYCIDSRDNWNRERKRMNIEEVLDSFNMQYEAGKRKFILYGGVDLYFDTERFCSWIKSIKSKFADIELYISVGEKVYEAYKEFYDAGADGFILMHRSANEEHFSKIHPMEMYPFFRKQVLPILREIGYKIGTGITVGWPYQTAEHIAEDIEFVKDLKPDMVIIDSFEPQKETAYEDFKCGSKKQTENVRGIISMMLPEAKILTGLR